MRLTRWLTVSVLLAALLSTQPALAAAKVPATSLHLHAAAASFRVSSPVTVTGTVRPKSLKQITIEALAGRRWVVVGHAKPSAAGTFTTSVRAPKSATTWQLRAVRAKSAAAKAGLSGVLRVHVVKTAYAVTATAANHVVSGTPVGVAGKVSAKAKGTVWLQGLVGKTWHNLASAKLSKTSTYTVSSGLAVGSHRLRVSKAATTTIAGGLSQALTVVVDPVPVVAPPALSITTTTLPAGTAELAYHAQLSATGGVAPYTWAAAGLPAGLTLAADGVITGAVATPLTAQLSVIATDAAGRVTRAVVTVTFALSPFVGNSVVGWGTGVEGSLGVNGAGVQSTPLAIPGLTGVTAVTGADRAGFALRFNGAVYSWGADFSGQLGDNFAAGVLGRATPLQVAGLPVMTAVAPGQNWVLALAADGTVWAWGANFHGQLGDGSLTERDVPIQVPNLTGVTAIAAEESTAVALKSDGTVWAWGFGSAYGTLGNGGTTDSSTPVQVHGLNHVTAIAAAGVNAAALASNGTVWEWGYGENGVIGGSSTTDALVPVQVGSLTGVTQIALQSYAGYALDSTGALWSWGSNAQGQLGVGDASAHSAPVRVGQSHVVAVTAAESSVVARLDDGTLRAWGIGVDGQLGNGQVMDSSSPVQVTGVMHAVGTGAGWSDSYAIVAPG